MMGMPISSQRLRLLGESVDVLRAGDEGHVALVRQLRAIGLVAHLRDRLGSGADERDALLLAALDEVGVLGEEAVARVDGVDPVRLRQSR